MMMMYSLHSTPTPLSLPSSAGDSCTTDVKNVDGADCCLIGIVLGVTMKKKYHPIIILPNICNIAQYPITQCQYRSNPSQ